MAVDASDQQWTIDEFAQRTGMTVRNIRAHQSRGLLAPPTVRGRTGYYGPEQAARIELIQQMQSEGFNLEAIRRLLAVAPDAGPESLDFVRAVHAPYGAETPQPVTGPELIDDWGPDSPQMLEAAVAAGVIRVTDDGGFEYPSPGLIRAAKEVVALGIPIERQLDLLQSMRGSVAEIAEAFVGLFIEQVWEPFEAEGAPEHRWQEITAALQKLRPLAGEVLQSAFAAAMNEASDAALARESAGPAQGA